MLKVNMKLLQIFMALKLQILCVPYGIAGAAKGEERKIYNEGHMDVIDESSLLNDLLSIVFVVLAAYIAYYFYSNLNKYSHKAQFVGKSSTKICNNFINIIGPSSCGKTTLFFRLLNQYSSCLKNKLPQYEKCDVPLLPSVARTCSNLEMPIISAADIENFKDKNFSKLENFSETNCPVDCETNVIESTELDDAFSFSSKKKKKNKSKEIVVNDPKPTSSTNTSLNADGRRLRLESSKKELDNLMTGGNNDKKQKITLVDFPSQNQRLSSCDEIDNCIGTLYMVDGSTHKSDESICENLFEFLQLMINHGKMKKLLIIINNIGCSNSLQEITNYLQTQLKKMALERKHLHSQMIERNNKKYLHPDMIFSYLPFSVEFLEYDCHERLVEIETFMLSVVHCVEN